MLHQLLTCLYLCLVLSLILKFSQVLIIYLSARLTISETQSCFLAQLVQGQQSLLSADTASQGYKCIALKTRTGGFGSESKVQRLLQEQAWSCHVHKTQYSSVHAEPWLASITFVLPCLCHSHYFLYFSIIQGISALITENCFLFSSNSLLFFFIRICFTSKLYSYPCSYCICILSEFLLYMFLGFLNFLKMGSPTSP